MYVRPFDEAECFKYLGSQLAADGGCARDVLHKMNVGYSKPQYIKYMGYEKCREKEIACS